MKKRTRSAICLIICAAVLVIAALPVNALDASWSGTGSHAGGVVSGHASINGKKIFFSTSVSFLPNVSHLPPEDYICKGAVMYYANGRRYFDGMSGEPMYSFRSITAGNPVTGAVFDFIVNEQPILNCHLGVT